MKELSNAEIKQVLLKELLHFHHFCEEHGLRYFLDSGTLLGAVRHKGFIPWDDDIDVAMPRPDYERLRELYPKHNTAGNYVLHDYRRNPACPYPFLKISDENTLMLVPGKDDIFPMGLFIDIFPLDGMPETGRAMRRHAKRIKFLRNLSVLSALHTGIKGRSPLKAFLVWLFKRLPHGSSPGYWNGRIERMALKYPLKGSRYVGDAVFGDTNANCQAVRAEVYEHPMPVEFEGHQLWGMEDYDQYLTVCYGDYMTPPPVERRQGIHVAKCYSKDGE